jgi:hypothetical protein
LSLEQSFLSHPRKKKKGQDGQQWSKTMISYIFTNWNTLWEACNSDRHGNDVVTKAHAHKDQALLELENLYAFRNVVLSRDRSLFLNDLADHKEKPTNSI